MHFLRPAIWREAQDPPRLDRGTACLARLLLSLAALLVSNPVIELGELLGVLLDDDAAGKSEKLQTRQLFVHAFDSSSRFPSDA